MKAIVLDGFGGPEVLKLGDVEAPVAGAGRVLVAVHATSVNRPDVVQRQGHYPPPPGESPILGLEAAGTVEAVGDGVTGFARGERVLALLGGGGYAELAAAHAGHVMRMPESLSFEQAACICETYLTAYMNLFLYARLGDGETVLVHGVDVILDHLGGAYLAQNVRALAVGGRLAVIGVMGGRKAELDLGRVLANRLSILGSVLRPRPVAEKAAIVQAFERDVMPYVAAGRIVPLIHRVYPLEQAPEAHRAMENSEHFGKLVLRVR